MRLNIWWPGFVLFEVIWVVVMVTSEPWLLVPLIAAFFLAVRVDRG